MLQLHMSRMRVMPALGNTMATLDLKSYDDKLQCLQIMYLLSALLRVAILYYMWWQDKEIMRL